MISFEKARLKFSCFRLVIFVDGERLKAWSCFTKLPSADHATCTEAACAEATKEVFAVNITNAFLNLDAEFLHCGETLGEYELQPGAYSYEFKTRVTLKENEALS